MSDTVTPKNDDDASGSWLSSPKDCVFPETIPEEASSVEEERVVIFRLPATSNLFDQPFYTADASLLQQQPRQPTAAATAPRSHFTFDPIVQQEQQQRGSGAAAAQPKLSSSTEKDSNNGSFRRSGGVGGSCGDDDDDDADGDGGHNGGAGGGKVDVFAATFLDVAVLRCLFVEHWQEDGVYWCLHYMYNR